MKKIIFLFFLISGCHTYTASDREEKRRAEAEMKSVLDMVVTKEIAPIEFETGSAKLKPSSFPLLDKVAQVLLKYPKIKLIVEGHTDDVGGEEYNKDLSLRRADSVKTYLVRKGVYPDYIRIYGYGKSRPAVKGTLPKDRKMNRRVEFRLTTRHWATVF